MPSKNSLPLNNPLLIGHESQRRTLHQILLSGKLPQATLLIGTAGIGKKEVALELIRSMFCIKYQEFLASNKNTQAVNSFPYGGCGVCKTCTLLVHNNLPDFIQINCLDKEQVNVEAIREILYSLNLNPYIASARIVLLDNAEYLNTQSANALLKSLEEPRPSTYYFLVCANALRLPSTIVSRCQVWYFDDLSNDQIKTILASSEALKKNLNEDNLTFEDMAIIADGSLENISEISAHIQTWRELRNNLISIAAGDKSLAVELASELAKDKLSLRPQLKLMRSFARYELQQRAASPQKNSWAQLLLDLISSEKMIFERNLSSLQVLTTIFLRLTDAAKELTFTEIHDGATFLGTKPFTVELMEKLLDAAPSNPISASPASTSAEELIDIDYFSKIKLRVAIIEAAEAIPKSRKLIKLQLNLGDSLGKRQILAGVAQHYQPEQLVGKKIVVVANLKPAVLMGLESQGMLLAASTEDGSTLCILEPSADIPAGSTVR